MASNAASQKRLPRWMARYLTYGLSGKSPRQKRKLFALNVISAVGGLNTLTFVFGYLMYDPSLWPASLVATAIALLYLTLPLVFHRLPRSAVVAYVTILSCALFFAVTFLLGAGTRLDLFLLVVPAGVLVVLGPAWRVHLVLTTLICVATILAIAFLNQTPALAAANDPWLSGALTILSITGTAALTVGVAFVAFLQAERAEDALEAEHARSEALLYNLLPEGIAARLKEQPDSIIADKLPQVAILFADIVDFTPRAARLTPEEVVGFLNRVFSRFDALADRHGLEKIKTIGDAYMVAAGMPNPCQDPTHRVAEMALDMLKAVTELPGDIELRIGLHAGPAVAGVIGNTKLFYDVWGETVNTASRMESHGAAGRIQVTDTARAALQGAYVFEPRGPVDIKGLGLVDTWWLVGRA